MPNDSHWLCPLAAARTSTSPGMTAMSRRPFRRTGSPFYSRMQARPLGLTMLSPFVSSTEPLRSNSGKGAQAIFRQMANGQLELFLAVRDELPFTPSAQGRRVEFLLPD